MGAKEETKGEKHVRRMLKKEHIFIGIPAGDCMITGILGVMGYNAAVRTMDPDYPYRFTFHILNGHAPVSYARNRVVGNFLKSDATRLWFIDADMLPPANCWDMLSVDDDIVSGAAMRWVGPRFGEEIKERIVPHVAHTFFKANEDTGNYDYAPPVLNETGQFHPDAVGSACMLIKRRVLEDTRMWHDDEYVDRHGNVRQTIGEENDGPEEEGFAPPLFQDLYKPNGQRYMGQDIYFCERAKALGYGLTVDFKYQYGHYKVVDLCNVAEFAQFYADKANEISGQMKEMVEREIEKSRGELSA